MTLVDFDLVASGFILCYIMLKYKVITFEQYTNNNTFFCTRDIHNGMKIF